MQYDGTCMLHYVCSLCVVFSYLQWKDLKREPLQSLAPVCLLWNCVLYSPHVEWTRSPSPLVSWLEEWSGPVRHSDGFFQPRHREVEMQSWKLDGCQINHTGSFVQCREGGGGCVLCTPIMWICVRGPDFNNRCLCEHNSHLGSGTPACLSAHCGTCGGGISLPAR